MLPHLNDSLALLQYYAIALLLGAMIGLERERADKLIAGMRTFTLVSLFGGVCVHLAALTGTMWIPAAGLLAVTALVVMGNLIPGQPHPTPGLTTEFAVLVTFAIGSLCLFGQRLPATVLAFACMAVLYFKPHLHAFSRKVQTHDLYAVFQFGLVTFVILPILPNQSMGPFDAINPRNVWWMVVLISGMSLCGYVLLKLVHRRWGGPALGVLGGLVSSTATTLTFSRHARRDSNFVCTAAVVVILASTIVLVRVAVEVAAIHPRMLTQLVPGIGGMFVIGLLSAGLVWRRVTCDEAEMPETRNPAELRSALTFGLLYGLVLLAVSAGKHYFGDQGVYMVSFISGLTDVDAITLSSARLASTGVLTNLQACNAIIIALLANLLFKLGLAGFIGSSLLARKAAGGFIAMALAGLAALAL